MTCPKCNLTVDDDARFCEHCGSKLFTEPQDNAENTVITDDIEKTMAIPVVNTRMATSENASPVREKVLVKTDEVKPKIPNESLKKKLLISSVSFVITLVVGFSILAAVIFIGNSSPKPNADKTKTEVTQGKKEKKPEDKKLEDIPEGESVGIEEKAGIFVDTDFDFKLGKTIASAELSYKTLKSTDYNYVCDIPSSFKFVSDSDGEIRYRAEDNTAYMDIGAFSNEDNLSCNEIKKMVTDKLGTGSESGDSGEGWFTMTTVSDGVVYCFKCYADEYIRYVEFAYPTEYRDVYDVYVSDIEPTFEKLD